MSTTRGVCYIHSTPSVLCPHIEWAVGGVLGMPVGLDWIPQPVEPGRYRAEYTWTAAVGTSAQLASALKRMERVRFEVTEDRTANTDAERYSYTPTLGVFHASAGAHGDIMVGEERIKRAVSAAALGGKDLMTALDELLGRPWDAELEPFRHAGEHSSVRWLHKVS
jgi:hypothetical protein